MIHLMIQFGLYQVPCPKCQGTEAKVAAGPAVSIEEIWKETAMILDTEPAKGGLLPLPDAAAPAPARSGSICNLVYDADEFVLSRSASNTRMHFVRKNHPSCTLLIADVFFTRSRSRREGNGKNMT